MDNLDYKSIDYTYLSGISGILADRIEKADNQNKYQYKSITETELSLYDVVCHAKSKKLTSKIQNFSLLLKSWKISEILCI